MRTTANLGQNSMYRVSLIAAAAASAICLSVTGAEAAKTPAILLSATNKVPACVTPERLMEFVRKRNSGLDSQFDDVAKYYKQHGEALGVRWDYAFYQMIVETNWLKYKTGSGKWGDVRPSQNNFAGIGATGGGVRGESFPDVSTGVLGHLGHIRLYSGKPVDEPAAQRTKLVEDIILPWAQQFDRPVTFTDLTTKWSPGDKGYSDDIETIAVAYRGLYCTNDEEIVQPTEDVTASVDADAAVGEAEASAAADASQSADVDTAASDGDGGAYTSDPNKTASLDPAATATDVLSTAPKAKPGTCKVFTASYGGAKSLLIQSDAGGAVHYTALAVHDGKEAAQAQAFINAYAKGGHTIGTFGSQNEALTKAFQLCPES